MIAVNNLTVQFGSFELLKDISFMVNPRDRIGLVGKNGAGKTTLLKILSGLEKHEKGSITKSNDTTIGYLPQVMVHKDGKTVFEETLSAFDELLKIEQLLHELNAQLAERTDYESAEYLNLIQKLSETNERYDLLGGKNKDEEIEKILNGLGFERKDFQRQTSEFSGGWRMRIELAKLLLRRPDFFLLDEPTNHLDIESIQWLEEFLKDYPGGVVLVSHDRTFLDTVTNRTIEIMLGKIYDYKASYSKYVELRQERREQQIAAYNNQQKMIEETEDFIERFRYKATKAVQVQSRIKQLDKIERIEIDDEDTSTLHIKFPPAPRSGTVVVEARDLEKNYGSLQVFSEATFQIERGQKVAFVGRNGEGKSTLAKIIMQQIDYEGEFKLGHNTSIGYFAQNQADLIDPNYSVFDTLDKVAVGEIRTQLRNILGAFLFSGDSIEKKVMVLSGGERSRLALAQLLLQPYSLLLLDEPTNHLDMRSKDILKQALLNYDGTLIVVSHDRYFLDGLVDKIYEFRNKRIKEHLCGIQEFLQKRKMESLQEIERKDKRVQQEIKEEKISDTKQLYLEKKEYEKKLRKIQNKIKESENRISQLENEIAKCETELANPAGNMDSSFFSKYENFKKELESEMENWENYHTELEEFENQ